MHGLAPPVDEKRDGMIFEHELEQAVIRLVLAHEDADVAPAQSFLAHAAQDVRRHRFHFDATVRSLDDLHARALVFLRLDWRMKEALLDCRKRRRMKAACAFPLRAFHRIDLPLRAHVFRDVLQLLQRAIRTVEESRPTIVRCIDIYIERQRDRDIATCRQKRCEHLPFLRVEENEAIDPETHPLDELCGRQFFNEQLHHVLGIIIAPFHGLGKARREKRQVAQFVRERVFRCLKAVSRFLHIFRRELITLELFERL